METSFEYQGPAIERGLYAAIGHQYYGAVPWFNEKVFGHIRMAIPSTPTLTKYYSGVDVPITSGNINPAESPFDLYVKIADGIVLMGERLDDVITVTSLPKEYFGQIAAMWINKAPEGSRIPLPTTVAVDDRTFEVGVSYINNSGFAVTAGCKVEV